MCDLYSMTKNVDAIRRLFAALSALCRIWRVALQTPARSPDRTRSPAAVSQKREYFKYSPETIGNFSLELAKFGVWRPTTNLQKPAIGGHFSDLCG